MTLLSFIVLLLIFSYNKQILHIFFFLSRLIQKLFTDSSTMKVLYFNRIKHRKLQFEYLIERIFLIYFILFLFVHSALSNGEINGYFIPKGTVILSNLWAVHHDKEYWGEDADEFKPERFLTDDGQDIKKWDHFIPFSIGNLDYSHKYYFFLLNLCKF